MAPHQHGKPSAKELKRLCYGPGPGRTASSCALHQARDILNTPIQFRMRYL